MRTDDGCTVLEGFPLDVKDPDVWRWMGSGGRRLASLAQEVSQARLRGLALCYPRAMFRTVRVRSITGPEVVLDEDVRLEGEGLGQLFAGADGAVFLVVSLGGAVDREMASLFNQGKPTEAFVLDAVGSAAAAAALHWIAAHVCRQVAEDGLKSGPVLQPGQGSWDVRGQRAVFHVLPAHQIGVTLLDSCFMMPLKSQSAVIPIGRELARPAQPQEHPCRYCNAKSCPVRMAKES